MLVGCKGWIDQAQLLTLKLQQGLQKTGWWGHKIIYLLVHRMEWCFEDSPKGTFIAKRVGDWDKLSTRMEVLDGMANSLQAKSPSSAFLKVFVIPTPLNHGTHEEKTYSAFVLMMQDLPSWELTYPTLGKRKVIFKSAFVTGYVRSLEGR